MKHLVHMATNPPKTEFKTKVRLLLSEVIYQALSTIHKKNNVTCSLSHYTDYSKMLLNFKESKLIHRIIVLDGCIKVISRKKIDNEYKTIKSNNYDNVRDVWYHLERTM